VMRQSSAALFVAAATLALASGAAAIAIGARTLLASTHRAIALVAIVVALRAFATEVYEAGPASPWNPSATVLPFLLLFALAVHCSRPSTRGVAAMMVVHAFVVQTHVGNALIATVPVVVALVRRRSLRDVALAFVAAAVVWLPAALEAVRHPPGNIVALVRFFSARRCGVCSAPDRCAAHSGAVDSEWSQSPRRDRSRVDRGGGSRAPRGACARSDRRLTASSVLPQRGAD
jgi:hypothetical protein